MIDLVHTAFIDELKKIATVGVYTPGAAKVPKVKVPKMRKAVKSPPAPKTPQLQQPAAVPGAATTTLLSDY